MYNLQPVQLTLGLGKSLRVRVLDKTGRPVARARIGLDSFPRSGRSMPIPQVEFHRDTDAEGRVIWANAPDQELEFVVTASGYLRVDGLRLRPDDQEHVVTLPQALVIIGTVRDSVTGDLIPRFRLGIGWPEKATDGSVQPHWSDIDRFWLNFTGGEFRHSLGEAVIGGKTNPGYVFRFQAEGHAPFVTRVYQADEGEVSLDVQLRPVEDIAAVAYLPDGRIARGAQVGFVAADSDARLVPGGFAGDLGHALAWVHRVDADGRFVVPGDESIKQVVIAHPNGYAEVSPEELRKAPAVRLAPWARLEGVWQVSGQPVTNGEIGLLWSRRPVNGPTLDSQAFHARTDANGHFTFPQVPPGFLGLVTWQKGSEASAAGGVFKNIEFEARAGETSQVIVADTIVPSGQVTK